MLNMKEYMPPSVQDLETMIAQLNHRGPDDYGYYNDKYIGLAHSRLSIIDINGGHQPIHDSNKDYWVVFNGEIFNYIELRQELIEDGFKFYTQTDTEVIVYLYKKYGLDFVNHLNGQFAIALWDSVKKRLVLTRDRVGIAPLFYHKDRNRLYFGSEIKAILPVLEESPTLNIAALDELLTFWSPVAPNTLFQNIYEVKPGELTIVESGEINHKCYWEWEFPENRNDNYLTGSDSELAEELHDKLVEATKLRLRSDVPVAAYLSGGLDSSALVSIIHHHGNIPLRTFSIGFEDNKLDESSYQQKLIKHLGTDHSSILCTSKNISDNFENTIWHTESTILRTAPVPMKLLSGLVKQYGFKVVLTGEGADEVLGGYDIFKEGKIRQFWAKNPKSSFRPLLLKKLYPYLDINQGNSRQYLEAFFGIGLGKPDSPFFAHLPRWETTSKVKMFYSDDLKDQLNKNAIDTMQSSLHIDIQKWHPFNRSQYIEARSLMAKYLLCSQGDRMLMANSVEGRFPFLDHNVIEFANRLNPNLKMKVLNEKYLLKRSMSRYVPEDIINRHKQPYRAPDIPSFIHDHTPDYVYDLLSESNIKETGYFDPRKTNILMRKIKAGRALGYKDNMAFMTLLSTQVWDKLFIKKILH